MLQLLAGALMVLLLAPQAYGNSTIRNNWLAAYSGSASYTNAGCALCHSGSTSELNQYGHDLQSNSLNFGAIEGFPSVNINGGTSYLDEINADTQPGWTTGQNNSIYGRNSGALITSTATTPGSVSGNLDPPISGCTVDADCDNGLFCDGTETCDTGTGTCLPGTNPCQPGETCDEINDVCVTPPLCTVDADCDDGLFCTTDTCLGGTCQYGSTCAPGETCDESIPACIPPVVSTPPKNQFNIVMNYELGMHCTGFEFAYCCVLPPYNSILAQVIKTEKSGGKPRLLKADPNVGLDGLGRPTVVRDTELDGSNNFRKYVLRYWHDAQTRNNITPGSALQISTLISSAENNSLLMWNTRAEGAVTDNVSDPLGPGALTYGTTDGSDNVVQGNYVSGAPDFSDANDNYWNAIWNHLYIYVDAADPTPIGPNLEGYGKTGIEDDKKRLGVQVLFPENTGAALHPLGPIDGDNDGSTWDDATGAFGPFGNVLTFSKDEGTVVYTQMKVLEDLPVMLTSPRIWEALGLPLTPFEDTINFFGDPGAVDEPSIRPYVRMRAQLHNYDDTKQFGIGSAVLDNGNPVIGTGSAPIDIPNCERCHALADGASVNSAQNGKSMIDQQVQDEIDYWNAYYGINPGAGDSDWYSRLKGAAISILAIHDAQHGTAFMANWPASDGTCTAGDPGSIGNVCTSDAMCDSVNGFVCTSGPKNVLGNACTTDSDCTRGKKTGTCEQVSAGDGVCTASGSPQASRLGHGSVMCQRCHADNVIAVVKSANVGQSNIDNGSELAQADLGALIPPLTEAIHNNHANNVFADSLGRDGGCQGCHPAHRSDGNMLSYPITELGLNAYAGGDNRDAAGGCFVGRDVHSNRVKETNGAGTPEHLNAVGQWLQANVASDTGTYKGIWCTNCHSQLGQELWKTDNWSDPVHNVGTTLRNQPTLDDIAAGLGISTQLAESWLDPRVGSRCDKGRDAGNSCQTDADCRGGNSHCVQLSPDGLDHSFAVWTEDPGLCDYAASVLPPYPAASAYQDGNVATIEVDLSGGGANCLNAADGNFFAAAGPDCDGDPAGNPDFYLCGSLDTDGDFSVNALTFCTTTDCVTAAQGTLGSSTALPVPMSAATDGRDHWLAPGEPHCADCHAAPYVEQSGNQNPYTPFNYPNKPALFRYTRGHQDVTCQGCHESTHGLYPVTPPGEYGGTLAIDQTTWDQAAGMNTDGSHGPLNCGACHAVNASGVIAWADMVDYNGQPIANDYDAAVSWAHTYTDEADPLTTVCLNCHTDYSSDVSPMEEEWVEHTWVGRISRSAMDKAELATQGFLSGDVAGPGNPWNDFCTNCHLPAGDNHRNLVECTNTEWKLHLTDGRVAESVWEDISTAETSAGTTCGY